MSEPFISSATKANAIIAIRYTKEEHESLMATTKRQDKIELLRDAVKTLIVNGIPTRTIAETLKKSQGAIQYHARYLSENGEIKKPKRTSQWRDAIK
jgi:DNA-binding NarL/FixJ family response regulator